MTRNPSTGLGDMSFSFDEKVLHASVYVILVAPDQLLLSKTICHQLGIVNYHPSVKAVQKCVLQVHLQWTRNLRLLHLILKSKQPRKKDRQMFPRRHNKGQNWNP